MGTTLQRLRLAAESLKLELPLFGARSPGEFDPLINGRTATALGVTMPQSILLRTDRVIG